jgi:hypothetical protein
LADIIKLAKHAPWGKVPIIGRLPKGAYLVGDPALVLRSDWNDFIAAFYAVSDDAAVFEFKGRKCFVSGISFGRLRDVIGGEAIELAILSKPDSLRTVFDRE